MPPALFKSVNFSTSNGLTLFLYGALSGLTFFLPLNLVQIQGYSEWQGGLVFFPMVLLIALLSPLAGRLVEKFSARIFLVVGPAITGAGFFIFGTIGQTSGPGMFWHTFFLPVLLMGTGMGITVAPLTTTVMSSVDRKNSGTASGVNNSVSRIAGLLAIALLGTYALHHFRSTASDKIHQTGLSKEVIHKFMENTADFAATRVPQEVPAKSKGEVRHIIHASFIDAFRNICHISAGAAWVSALLALAFIRRRNE